MSSGAEYHRHQRPQEFDITQKHIEDEQLLLVVRGPHESGQGGGQRVQVLREDVGECFSSVFTAVSSTTAPLVPLRDFCESKLASAHSRK